MKMFRYGFLSYISKWRNVGELTIIALSLSAVGIYFKKESVLLHIMKEVSCICFIVVVRLLIDSIDNIIVTSNE